ncbi:MAG: bifunctional phosphoribosylaminoimidazolecarboxamide formyltransferase/IMP cyclohydrolase [Spirochaetales bacterium]|nr:bifunctional phosphoribosylaminoimidazolecarboxamide formyltransferase/IMP cyclohydrolase [Spirochaetales bacterium]
MEKGYALISTWDKTGTEKIAGALTAAGYSILSTGGTKKYLENHGIEVISVECVTGFPEILGGRVKTLHPFIHGGLLMNRKNEEHVRQMEEKKIKPIDFLICNLYPFEKVLEEENAKGAVFTVDNAPLLGKFIENIDIGGVALLRAASKNFNSVTVISSPQDYSWIAERITKGKELTEPEKLKLAVKAFALTSKYDSIIYNTLERFISDTGAEDNTETPNSKLKLKLERIFVPRYGENPHQKAAVFSKEVSQAYFPVQNNQGLLGMKQLQGKQLSYNNILDSQTAADLVASFKEPAVVLVKHQLPCGAAVGDDMKNNFLRAFAGDPVSPFGGIFAFNRKVDLALADEISDLFFEVLLAPEITEDAEKIFKSKKNLRVLTGNLALLSKWEFRSSGPLYLVQETDSLEDPLKLDYVTERRPDKDELDDLLFAYNVARMVKSNGIVLAHGLATAGIGSGQPNRVGALETALRGKEKMKAPPENFVMASDGFFPFGDTVALAAKAGCTAVIQPGGSIRDNESIEEANRHGIAMVFTGKRHFRH